MSDVNQEILLGLGKFSIYKGEQKIPIGYVRGGGKFTVTREYRPISYDGLKSYATEEMLVIDTENVSMEINMLSLFTKENMTLLYPGMKHQTGADGVEITSNDDLKVETENYIKVEWQGITNTGAGVLITINNAINVSNIDFTFADKSEVLQAIKYEGIAPKGETRCKWSIKWLTSAGA